MIRSSLACCCAALLGAAQPAAAAEAIQVNQLGFLPGAHKLAVVPAGGASRFALKDGAGKTVFEGSLGAAATWDASGEKVRLADFSKLATPGTYRIVVEGLADSAPFPIAADAYRALDAGAIRAYTLNRAGIALDARSPAPGRVPPAIRTTRCWCTPRPHRRRGRPAPSSPVPRAGTTPATTTNTSSTPASAPGPCWPPTSISRPGSTAWRCVCLKGTTACRTWSPKPCGTSTGWRRCRTRTTAASITS
jgi:hypothetical protein